MGDVVRDIWEVRHPRAAAVADGIALVVVAPLLVARRLHLVSHRHAARLVSLVPGRPGMLVRRAFYAATLEHCGARLRVGYGSVLSRPNIRVGDDCLIGDFNIVGAADIGDDFMSGAFVSIVNPHGHGFARRDLPMRAQPGRQMRIVIGPDVWAGTHAVIAADVAAHTILAAGAVATREHPEWSILGGVPARVVSTRPGAA